MEALPFSAIFLLNRLTVQSTSFLSNIPPIFVLLSFQTYHPYFCTWQVFRATHLSGMRIKLLTPVCTSINSRISIHHYMSFVWANLLILHIVYIHICFQSLELSWLCSSVSFFTKNFMVIIKLLHENILQVKVIEPCYAPLDVATVAKDVLVLFYVLLLCLYYLIVQRFDPMGSSSGTQ